MEVILLIGSMLTLVSAGQKCKTTVDLGIRWTVDCSAMNLSSAPPPVILHPVIALNMSQNNFTHLKESQFTNWSDILHLDISANSITNIDSNSFKGLTNLTDLNLMNNFIELLSPNVTSNLPKLRILNISFNKLKSILPETFKPIPLLLKLFLGSNPDLGKSVENYKELNFTLSQSLLSLDLANTSVTEISDNFFINAKYLIVLNIAQNPLKKVPDLPSSLRHLNISGIHIETLPLGLFWKSDLMQKLSLERMPSLKDIKEHTLSGLTNLEEIYIKDCPKLSFISSDSFGESSPKLRKVVISNCALNTLPKVFKEFFTKIEYLDLQGNPWNCDGRISWILDTNLLPNLTENLRCDMPLNSRGMLMTEYFKPRTLHPHHSLIRAGIVIAIVAVLVASVVGMVRQTSKQKAKTYRQLQDIRLQDLTPNT